MQSADGPKQPQDDNSRKGTMKLRDKCREVILCVPPFEEERDSAAFRDGVLTWDIRGGGEPRKTRRTRKKIVDHLACDLSVATMAFAPTRDGQDALHLCLPLSLDFFSSASCLSWLPLPRRAQLPSPTNEEHPVLFLIRWWLTYGLRPGAFQRSSGDQIAPLPRVKPAGSELSL